MESLRKNLASSLEKNNLKNVESALADFEAVLVNDEMKNKEKELLDKARAHIEMLKKSFYFVSFLFKIGIQ